jgi:hypothetical protein
VRYSLNALILLTLFSAMLANVWLQRQRNARAHAAIEELEWNIKLLNFDEAYVDSHTHVCELAIENNPLPSPYYLDALKRFEQTAASGQEQDK